MALYLEHFALVGPVGNFLCDVYLFIKQLTTQNSLVGSPTDIGEEFFICTFGLHANSENYR